MSHIGDTRDRWDRIGNYLLSTYTKKILTPLIYVGMVLVVIMLIATVFMNQSLIAQEYSMNMAQIRFDNIKH